MIRANIKNFWRKILAKHILIVLIDFLLLAFAVYAGYALRFGRAIPYNIGNWQNVLVMLPFICVIVFAAFKQYGTIWPHAGTEDFIKFAGVYVIAFLAFLLLNLVLNFADFSRVAFSISFLGVF